MSEVVMLIGVFIIVIGSIFLLIEAFKEHVAWGIVCFLITPVFLLFVILNWGVSKQPVKIQLAGFFVIIVGVFIGSTG